MKLLNEDQVDNHPSCPLSSASFAIRQDLLTRSSTSETAPMLMRVAITNISAMKWNKIRSEAI